MSHMERRVHLSQRDLGGKVCPSSFIISWEQEGRRPSSMLFLERTQTVVTVHMDPGEGLGDSSVRKA